MWKLFAMVLVVSDTGAIATSQIATDFATPEACQQTAEPERRAYNAAEIGDTVMIKYPNGTIICERQSDMEQVYITGRMVTADTYRLNHNSYAKAVEAGELAERQAMRTAYSCHWPKDRTR